MSKTKIVGYLLVVMAAVKIAIDALDGGGFDFQANFAELATALAGAGFVFLRKAIDKVS